MTITPRISNVAAGWLALCLAIPSALAQDADPYAADFDPDQPIRIEGQVKDLQWTNPRAWLIVTSAGAESSGPTEFSVMLPAIAVLERLGWTRETLGPGDSVLVDGHPARDGTPHALARRVETGDGDTLLDLNANQFRYSRSGAGLIQGAQP